MNSKRISNATAQILSAFGRSLVLGATALVIGASQASAQLKPIGNPNAPQKGTFTINLDLEPETLNPITTSDLYGREVMKLTMDTLMTLNYDTWEYEPGLAEKMEISKDGTQFTFTLRKDAKFWDGKPVTAEDIKFSFDAIFFFSYNAAHIRPYYENISKAEVLAPNVVRFTAKTKYFGNVEQLSDLYAIPKHVYGNAAEGKKMNKTLMGSGPFKIEKYDKGQSLVLVRNKDWWGNNVAHLKGTWNFERVRMRFLKESNVTMEALKKGDIDYSPLSSEDYEKKAVGPEWGKTVKKVKTENLAPKGYGYLGWNFRREMFKDKKVRLAMTQLMNREEMNKKFFFGNNLLATGPWYQQSEYADPSVKPIAFDPKKALENLKAAGWTDSDKDGILDKVVNGKKENLSFTLIYGSKDTEKWWVFYQSDLKKVGIDMKLQLLDWNAMLKTLDEGKFDVIAMGWGGGSVHMDPKQIWHSSSAVKGGSNYIGYSNPAVDKLIDQAREEMDKKKRVAIMRKIYAAIADDVPYTFMFNNRYVMYGHSTKVAMAKPTYKYDIGTRFWWSAQ